jgi:hypothetical protein
MMQALFGNQSRGLSTKKGLGRTGKLQILQNFFAGIQDRYPG